MSGERRKVNKQCTGTVPKIKYRNNTSYDQESSRSLSNNLSSFWHNPSDSSNFIRNPKRNPRNNYLSMDVSMEQQNLQPVQNGAQNYSNSNSSSDSRRNSTGSTLKCDNVTKYPDKKQIEDKLSQIREYLQITNSLMNGFKNTDDQAEKNSLQQMFNDLKDSEKKLVAMLEENQEIEANSDTQNQVLENGTTDNFSDSASSHRNLDNQEMEGLREQQFALMRLHQKAENRLKDVRNAQDKLLVAQFGNQVNVASQKDNKNMSLSDFDSAIKELEERAKGLKPPQQQNTNIPDKIMSEVESLHNKIMTMHQANNEREQLIEVLDNRDSELRSQQAELQNKLAELQSKKQKIDQLVTQLQTIDDEEQDDVGAQVRKIVTMKDQLKKLKDMLEIVKTTENVMENTNYSAEAQAAACEICTTAENFLQNEIQKPRPNESNVILQYENESRQKQVNSSQNRGAKPRTTSINEQTAVRAELEAKKKELEDIMGKHKAGTSNLNHDVADNKSEFSCPGNSVNEHTYWRPLVQLHTENDAASDRFSSEDEYSELHQNVNPAPTVNYPPSNASKQGGDGADYVFPMERFQTPERNARGGSVATSGFVREQPRSNNPQDKLQKQLQLIKSVCDSMLDQENLAATPPTQQLRNNLTPSPYSEPRRFATPTSHALNAVNVLNTNADVPWNNSNMHPDFNNYHSWLTTNTLQTQSFMMNTLNQCCQMLWLQQRELVSLRNTVSALQERVDGQCPSQPSLATPLHQSRPCPPPKHNQQVSAACSMPNLNHYNAPPNSYAPPPNNYAPPPNNYSALHPNNYNAPTAGFNAVATPSNLEMPYLNNVNMSQQDNNVLHANINQSVPIWNGQALNNQVAPGNRANNYWDNFRSYSRQNLLSSKNTDSSTADRSNVEQHRTNPFTLISFSKSNSDQDSASTSHQNTPQRRPPIRIAPHHLENVPPPDVLNVNRSKVNSETPFVGDRREQDSSEELGCVSLTFNEERESNITDDQMVKEGLPRRRNEAQGERVQKSKLFEELRDNVYKEVASLISANEARPHFLIQLFRDLQMIGSDSLRLKILQSIQSVVTNSLMASQGSNRQSIDSQQSRDSDPLQLQDNFSLQSTVWSKQTKNYLSGPRNMVNLESDESEIQNAFKEIIPFLSDHENETIDSHFLHSLRQALLDSESFKEAVKDTIFQKHFSNVLDEVLEQYCGKKVKDVKPHLIQTVTDLLRGELSFIQLIHETNPENCHSHLNDCHAHPTVTFNQSDVFDGQRETETVPIQNGDNIQNGDLAEADQSRIEEDDVEEEGAVGGVLEVPPEGEVKDLSNGNSEEIISLTALDFPCNSEGLDQVPTRLPTKSKSRSTTPSRDRANSANSHSKDTF